MRDYPDETVNTLAGLIQYGAEAQVFDSELNSHRDRTWEEVAVFALSSMGLESSVEWAVRHASGFVSGPHPEYYARRTVCDEADEFLPPVLVRRSVLSVETPWVEVDQ